MTINANIEKWYPFSLGILSALFALIIGSSFPVEIPASIKDILTASINLSSIIIAFLAAVQAVLFSINHEQVIKHLKQAGVYKILVKYLMNAIHCSIFFAFMSSAGLVLDFSNPKKWYLYAFCVWIFSLVRSVLSCYRIIRLFNKVLDSLA